MGVIIAVIRSRTGHSHRLSALLQITDEMPIEPFASIIEIQTQQPERQGLLDLPGLFQNPRSTAVPHGAAAGPGAGKVRKGEAPNEAPGQAAAAVGHAVGFQKTSSPLVPNLSLNRDLLPQQTPGFGA